MASTSVRCPTCAAVLKLATRPPAGKKVRCPKCASVFIATDDERPVRSTAVKTKLAPQHTKRETQRNDDDGFEEMPRGRKSRPAHDEEKVRPRSTSKARKYSVDDEDDDDRRRFGKKKKTQGNGMLIAICVGVGIVALLGVGGLIWGLSSGSTEPAKDVIAKGPGLPNLVQKDPNQQPPKRQAKKDKLPAGGEPGDLPKELRDKISRATAYIRVDVGNRSATGSGFLVKASGDTAYVVTNHHVVAVEAEAPPPKEPVGKGSKGPKKGPGMKGPFGGRGPFGQPAPQPKASPRLTVILHSGTPEEQSIAAEVVAIDEEADLAALRVTGVRNLPAALDLSQEAPIAEQQPVFIFGFPLGKAPINIGKGSIGGIRRDDNNEIVDVHINGEVNPGNSGGPVVDSQGRLVGIAVSTVVGKQIGFVVPAGELNEMFKGRLHVAAVFQMKQQGALVNINGEAWVHDRKSNVRERNAVAVQIPSAKGMNMPADQFLVYARLSDPMLKIKGANLYLVRTEDVPAKPNDKGWSQLANATRIALKIQDQDAMGDFRLPMGAFADETFAFQLSYVNADGQTIFTQPHLARLTFPKNLKSATLNVTDIPDEPTRRYIEDSLPKWLPGKVSVKAKPKDGLVVEIDSVPDPKALVPKIIFGEVTGVQGRTFAVRAKKLDLPLPDTTEVSKALENLKSPDNRKRKEGADQLARAYAPLPAQRTEVAKALAEYVADNDFWLSKAVLQALSVWAGPENTVAIARALEHKDGNTRRAALEVLVKFKDPKVAPEIAKLLPSGFDRGEASSALKAIGAGAQKAVIPYLTHKDGFTAKETCYILKEIGTAECIAALTEVANSNNSFVSPAAREALKAVQGR